MTLPDWCLAPLPKTKRDLGNLVMRLRDEGYPVPKHLLKGGSVATITAALRGMRQDEIDGAQIALGLGISRSSAAFDGITASECNAFLATLPPVPLWGEEPLAPRLPVSTIGE